MPAILSASVLAAAMKAIDDDSPKSGLTVSGAIETYYGYASPYPGHGETRAGRQYDIHNGDIRLADAEVDIQYTDAKSGLGFHASPYTGDNSDIYYRLDSATNWLARYFFEFYGSYTSKCGAKFDFGKFASYIGYGNFDSTLNDTYSSGFVGSLLEPNFHTGLRVSYPVSSKLGLTGYITNGWNTTERKTQGYSWGGAATYDMGHEQSVSASFLTGLEGAWNSTNGAGNFGGIGFLQPGASNTTTLDLLYTKQWGDQSRIGLDMVYTTAGGSPNSGTLYGLALSGRTRLGHGLTLGARIESMTDAQGIVVGTPSNLSSAAIDLSYQVTKSSIARLELRADRSNNNLFADSGGGTRNTQNTLNLAYTVKF